MLAYGYVIASLLVLGMVTFSGTLFTVSERLTAVSGGILVAMGMVPVFLGYTACTSGLRKVAPGAASGLTFLEPPVAFLCDTYLEKNRLLSRNGFCCWDRFDGVRNCRNDFD